MYVLKRTDQGGGYVAPRGSRSSYVLALQAAQVYTTREAAERERCAANEVVVPLAGELQVARP